MKRHRNISRRMHYIPYHAICSKMHKNTWQMINYIISNPHNWIYYLLLVVLVSVFFIKNQWKGIGIYRGWCITYPTCSKMHKNTWQMINCIMSNPHNWIYYLSLVILVSVFFVKNQWKGTGIYRGWCITYPTTLSALKCTNILGKWLIVHE